MKILSNVLISQLRRKDLPRGLFRLHAHQLALCLAQQAAEHLATTTTNIATPLGTAQGTAFQKPLMLVPILRSGLVLLPAFIEYFPDATIGCVGMKRDEKTAIPNLYYCNLPKLAGNEQIIMLDPMIATGGSSIATLEILQKKGIDPNTVLFVAVIASEEGLHAVQKAFPKITILVTAVDKELNKTKFIVPGLGDFGDRYFGTE